MKWVKWKRYRKEKERIMAGNIIDFEEVRDFSSTVIHRLHEAHQGAGDFAVEIQNVVHDRSLFHAESAAAMAYYWDEVHGGILNAFKNSFTLFLMGLDNFRNDLSDVDGNPSAVINDDYLLDAGQEASRNVPVWEGLGESENSFSQTYGHIIPGQPMPLHVMVDMLTGLGDIETIATEQEEEMYDCDVRHFRAFDAIDDLLDGIESIMGSGAMTVERYSPGKLNRFISNGFLPSLELPEAVIDEMATILYHQFFNGNEINGERVLLVLFGEGEHLSQISLEAMARFFSDPRVDYDFIANVGTTPSNFPGLLSIFETRPTPQLEEGVQRSFSRISERIMERLIEEGNYLIRRYSFAGIPDRESLDSLLRRSLLLGFRSEEFEIVGFDADRFVRGGICFDCIEGRYFRGPHIVYNGNQLLVTSLETLFGLWGTEVHRVTQSAQVQGLRPEEVNRAMAGFALAWEAAKVAAKIYAKKTGVPLIVAGAARGVNAIGNIQGSVKLTQMVLNFTLWEVNRNTNLTPDQRQEIINRTVRATEEIGGGIAMTELPEGRTMVIGTNLSTQEA